MDPRKIQLPREIYTGPGVIGETGKICSELRFKEGCGCNRPHNP